MADTVTPIFGFVQPEVGASRNTWGQKLNSNAQAIEDAILTRAPANGAVGSFATRSALVAANTNVPGLGLSDGQTVTANGLEYKKQNGATVIPDLPGWVPNRVAFFEHFGAVGDGLALDHVAMQTALNSGAPLVKGTPGAIYKCNTPVVIPSGITWDFNGSMVRKGFRSGTSPGHFVLRTENSFSTDPAPWTGHDIHLVDVWVESDNTSATRGSLCCFNGDNITIDGFKARTASPYEAGLGGNALAMSGKGNKIYRVDIDTWDAGLVHDGLHFGYVEDLIVQGGTIRAGDDAIAFHPHPLNFPWGGPDKLAKNVNVSGLVLSTATSNGVRLGGWDAGVNNWPPHTTTVYHNVLIDVVIGQCGGYAVNLEERRSAAELSSGNIHTGITIRARIEKQADAIRMVQVNGNIDIANVANIGRKGYGDVFLFIQGEQSDLTASFPLLRAGGVEKLYVSGTFETETDPMAQTNCTFSQIGHLVLDNVVMKGRTTGTFASFKWCEQIDVFNGLHLADGTEEFQTYILQLTNDLPMSFRMSGGRIVETARAFNITGPGRLRDFHVNGTLVDVATPPNWAVILGSVTTWETGATFWYNPAGGYRAPVSQLPGAAVPVVEGHSAYATNGRTAAEGVGAGTGQPVYRKGTAWLRIRDDAVVTA